MHELHCLNMLHSAVQSKLPFMLCPVYLQHAAVSHLQTIAEKKGWELSKSEGFELVTIMPSLVLGPVTGVRADGTSINAFKVADDLICSTTAGSNNGTHACRLFHALHATLYARCGSLLQ